jgi:DNA-directed RNA polymerase specialized sigma subunit
MGFNTKKVMKVGRGSNSAKLDIYEVQAIQKIYGESEITMQELAKKYNVSATQIFRLVKNIETDNKKRGTGSVSKFCNFTKINENIATRILILYMSGKMTQKAIAQNYNIHQSSVSKLCSGKTWKHLFQGIKEKYNNEFLKISK